jgi:anthranilate synthase component I
LLNIQPPSFEEFERETARGNVVPVVRSVFADLQTPVGALLRMAGDSRYCFLLESVEGGERVARYSFVGVGAEMVARGRGEETIIERGDKVETRAIRATEFLREHFRGRKLSRRGDLAPLSGGVVGFLSYEAARWFEPVLEKSFTGGAGLDDAVWMFYRTIMAFDRVRQRIEITSVVLTEEASGSRERLRELYERAVEETARIERVLLEPPLPPLNPSGGEENQAGEAVFASNFTKDDFEEAVRRVKAHIAEGDCYQVVLSQRFTKKVSATPLSIYRALRTTNPSPYMFFLRAGDESVIGTSPEMLVRCRGRRLDYRPIAGTRRRGATEAEDLELGEQMRADHKEVAEHMMLVDLGRNDLGRVAEFGSVTVDELMAVERYSHVQHLVTSLSARLCEGFDRFDALAACFPAGTVTGAPKVRAMEIISNLEPDSRGVYAGAVLYADYADNLDSCIAIRTVRMKGEDVSIQAGAGIVADSVPESEYEETINKARALFAAIELAERGFVIRSA